MLFFLLCLHCSTTVALTEINQSVPNLVKMYMPIRSCMSFIIDLMGPDQPELCDLELEKFLYLTVTVYIIACTNINQSVPNRTLRIYPDFWL